ncbi:hypothetical protein Q3G72_015569 [Acer saccharum]|nr:hypothetical protein Q3G72_015569 [Acer saccharum]
MADSDPPPPNLPELADHPLPSPNPVPSTQTVVMSPRGSTSPSSRVVMSPRGSTSSSSSGRHPIYHGIRSRSGKWVSEIREPRKSTRIWLGTYSKPEMAATAYDVAALALKGPDAGLNFPNMILSYPIPASTSASDIRAAAARAVEEREQRSISGSRPDPGGGEGTTTSSSGTCMASSGQEFIDEDALLNMPSLLVDMAEGMLVSPPRIKSPPSDEDSPGNSDAESLWSYS